MLNAVDCVKKAATAACGKEAAEHQVRKENLYIQPLADEIHCNLDPKKGEKVENFRKGKGITDFKCSYSRNINVIISITV